MSEEPVREDWEQKPGDLPLGYVTFNNLPYDLTQAEVRKMRKELAERDERRGPLGFGR